MQQMTLLEYHQQIFKLNNEKLFANKLHNKKTSSTTSNSQTITTTLSTIKLYRNIPPQILRPQRQCSAQHVIKSGR